MTWSSGMIDVGIKASLIQSYSILLSTLFSIGRNQLSYFDAQYALDITSPPFMLHLAISSIGDLFGVKTSIYKRIKYHRRTTRALGILTLPLWLVLSLTHMLSTKAFTFSGGYTPREWLTRTMEHAIHRVMLGHRDWSVPLIIGSLIFLCLFREWSQVVADYRARLEGAPNSGGGRCMQWKPAKSVWMFCVCGWTAIGCAWWVSVVVDAQLTHFNAI